MEQAHWAPDRIEMLANLYVVLTDHTYCSSDSEVEKKTWVRYQAEQQIQWHLAIPSPKGTWDIGILSKVLMASTHTQVRDELCDKSEKVLVLYYIRYITDLAGMHRFAFQH